MPEGMRLRTTSERRAPARFGDPDGEGEENYIGSQVPQTDYPNSKFPRPVYQFDNQLARECAFPTLPFNHPGPGPSGAILNEKRKNGGVTILPQHQPAVSAGTGHEGSGDYQDEEDHESEANKEDQAHQTRDTSINPTTRDQTTISGKPNLAIQNHGHRGRLPYSAPAEDWIAAANQPEGHDDSDLDALLSGADQVDPELPSFGLDPRDRDHDDVGDWTRTSSEYHFDISPSPPDTASPHGDPFVTHPEVPGNALPEVGVSQSQPQSRRPYTVHIDRDAAKRRAEEVERSQTRNFDLRKLGQRAPDWVSLSDSAKYIITYEMTKTGMSFVQFIRTFRLSASEATELMNLVGEEQRKIDDFDKEIKKHLHAADLTWMDEYNKTHAPLITDHFTAKEIRLAKDFMTFMGFGDVASNLGGYVGVGAGRRFPISLNHFWGDGFRDLPPHFKVFCSGELDKMASTWDEVQKEHPPRLSTPEMLVRLDPPPGTINPRRLLIDPEPAPSARQPPGQSHLAGDASVADAPIRNPALPLRSATASFPPGLHGRQPHSVDAGYRNAEQAQPVNFAQHDFPACLPDPSYGVPINPFASMPPPSMPGSPRHSQHGGWQRYLQVQDEPQFPQGPQHQHIYHDRGTQWGLPDRYREPANVHFAMAMGEDQELRQPPMIIRTRYPPPPAHSQQPPDIDMHRELTLSPAFGHASSRVVPGSNHREHPDVAGLLPHRRAPGPMDHRLQQMPSHGLGDRSNQAFDPRQCVHAFRAAPQIAAYPSGMGHVPQDHVSSGELSRRNIANGSGTEMPLMNTTQLALLYRTYDQPRPSRGTLHHTAGYVGRSAGTGQLSHLQGNYPIPVLGRQTGLQEARHVGKMRQKDAQASSAQPPKESFSEPLLNYPRPKIQQRDPRLRKEVDKLRNKFQNTWTSSSESESEPEENEEDILRPWKTRSPRVEQIPDDDDDFVLPNEDEIQENKQEKRSRASLPSRKRAISAASAPAEPRKRSNTAIKKSANTVAPVARATNKRKAAQTQESQVGPKKRRVNDETSSTRASSSTSRSLRRKSAPAVEDLSDGGEYDEGKKSKPVRGRRQPGGVWGDANTMFTNGLGGFMKRSDVAALPNTKYRPGGSFGGGKWLEEDTGIMWLPVNPAEQCRKNVVENQATANCASGAEVVGTGEKTTKKRTKTTTQAVKKTTRLASQAATPSPSKIVSSQVTHSSATIGHSSPAMAPKGESFEELLSSKGFYTREKFETDSLFWAYISALGPPFSTHPGAPTPQSPPKGKSLDNYIPTQTRTEHEVYLATQKATGGEVSRSQDEQTQGQGQQNEEIQEKLQKSTRETQGTQRNQETQEKPRHESLEKTQEMSDGGNQEAGHTIEQTPQSAGEVHKEIQQQNPQAGESKENDLQDVLKNQGFDLDNPPALDTTEKLGRYPTRLRSSVFGLIPSNGGSSSDSFSSPKGTPSKKPVTSKSASEEPTTTEAPAEKAPEELDTEDTGTEEHASQDPASTGAIGGLMTIRTLRPRKGKDLRRNDMK
ncbi:hypothetical protein QC764_122790 [Podospora pseudoanserina]|uniref:Uncharacterized protein n=1 Tax=Podospora pseudoanserina TaxID=2609844 RepID=A0ABR0ITX5_9PEZI|nr:hypothetical protein QC764_122790 [Podospora pseudoanserina]